MIAVSFPKTLSHGYSVDFTRQKYIQTQPSIGSRSRIFNRLLEILYLESEQKVLNSKRVAFEDLL